MRDGPPILEVREVSKAFAGLSAVERLSFEIRRGEVFALLGPNGAGKTTTVRMLLDVLRPDSGSFLYRLGSGGASPHADPARVGYLPEERGLYREVPVLTTLVHLGVLRRLSRAEARERALSWLERLGLADRAKDRLDTLSKGNQQRVQLAAAVLHAPALAVLDEPFSGLDPLGQEAALDLLRSLREGGTTVLLSAHQMALVERVADRVLLMREGRELVSGTVGEVRARYAGGSRLGIRTEGPPDAAAVERLAALDAVESVERTGESALAVALRPGASIAEVLSRLSELRVVSIATEEPTLHEAYVRAVRGVGGGGES